MDQCTSKTLLTFQSFLRTLPSALAFCLQLLLGAGLTPLYGKQGIPQLQLLIRHLQEPRLSHNLAIINLQWAQLIAGTTFPILEQPQQTITHLANIPWITSLCSFLAHINGQLHTTVTPILPWRVHNQAIMKLFKACFPNSMTRPPTCLQELNTCRLYLQVETVANISDAASLYLNNGMLRGQPSEDSSRSSL